MLHKHRSFFPFVLALLTLGLLTFMAAALRERFFVENASEESSVAEQHAVTESEYRQEAQGVMSAFVIELEAAGTDAEKRSAVETAYNGMLVLLVPGGYRELHFGIVSSLYLMREGLYGDARMYETGWVQMQALLSDNPWLK